MGRMIPTAASATVDLTPVTNRLTVMEEAVNDDLTPRVTDIEEMIPSLGSKFRGDWSAGELAYSYDFSNGFTAGWNNGGAGTGAISGGSGRPAYSNQMTGGGGSQVVFKPSQVPALVGKTLVQIAFWHSIYRFIDGPTLLLENGSQKWSRSTGADSTSAWERQVVALSNTGDLAFQANGSTFFITGVEVFVAAQPYMLGEFVLYRGKMWKSKANNNSTTPGGSANWEETAVNFQQTYTTATRPSASTSGKGAQIYDQDLNIPLYSNGTAWTDATGTVR